MYYYLYDTATGILVGGPLSNEADAIRLAARYPNQAHIGSPEKIFEKVGAGKYKVPAKRVSLVTLTLQDWTQAEIDAYNVANSQTETDKKGRRESARDNKGQGASVPDIRDRLDNLIEVLQDEGVIPR